MIVFLQSTSSDKYGIQNYSSTIRQFFINTRSELNFSYMFCMYVYYYMF